MSSRAKTIANRMQDINSCYYPNSMYTIYPGSVLICYSIFEKPDEKTKQEIKRKFLKIQKRASKYYKTAEQYYDPKYTLDVFGLKKSFDWPVAVFVGKTNTLLAPYGKTDEDLIFAYPLREDGFRGPTLSHPVSVHELLWEKKSDDNILCSDL